MINRDYPLYKVDQINNLKTVQDVLTFITDDI